MANFLWVGILLLVLGLVAVFKSNWLVPLFGWKAKMVGAKVEPPKNVATQYRIIGIMLALIGAYLIYKSL